jgi:hypothetical protein
MKSLAWSSPCAPPVPFITNGSLYNLLPPRLLQGYNATPSSSLMLSFLEGQRGIAVPRTPAAGAEPAAGRGSHWHPRGWAPMTAPRPPRSPTTRSAVAFSVHGVVSVLNFPVERVRAAPLVLKLHHRPLQAHAEAQPRRNSSCRRQESQATR